MKTKTHISGIYKPRMRRPEIIVEDTTSSRRMAYTGYVRRMFPGINVQYSFHNGLDRDVFVYMSDGSQFLLKSSVATNNCGVIEYSLCVCKTVGLNVNDIDVNPLSPLRYKDEKSSMSYAQDHLVLSRENTLKTIEERVGADNRGSGTQPFNCRKHHSNVTTINPEANLIFKVKQEDFADYGNVIFCKELSCVFVYGTDDIPEYNPHPFFSGIDADEFMKAATTASGQSINISIIDNSGSTSQTSFYVPVLGKEVKINTVFDETVCESGVYITHFKVAPNGVMVKDETETRFYTFDDALADGLIYLTKEDAVTGGTREARWKQHLAKEEFARKMHLDTLEWERKKDDFDRKQKALEADMERQRILHEQKLEAERIKMEREAKAHRDEMERKARDMEFEQQKRKEEDQFDKDKKHRENANDKGSTFRKALIDVLKMIPAVLAAATAVLVWMAKKSAAAAVVV